jgi:hypothetical protein
MIKENKVITDDLNFKPVSSDFLSKQINKLNIKKATGYDGISPKILKISMPCIVEPIRERPFNLKGGVMVFF